MKRIIILGDGMADWKVPSLGHRTLLQYAHTPNMDRLAKLGRTGMLQTVAQGFHPGSEVANMSVLGYDMSQVYQGRGVLEAASMGVELVSDDMAMRCNLVCVEGDILKNHSAGHISTAEADELMCFLQENLGGDTVHFYTGVSYRHLLVMKGADKRIHCTPPHDAPLQPFHPLLVKSEVAEAAQTAERLNDLILCSQELLKQHPINLKRKAEGKDMANSIWPWSPGYRPAMIPLHERYPDITQGSVITAVDLIRGIGHYAGLRRIDVEGATGLYDTNYERKTAAALAALKQDDLVYLHIEASDEAGHEGDVSLKLKTIENLDARVVGPIYEEVKNWDEPVAIAVLPDHPTPCELRTHTAEAVPFLIWSPTMNADEVSTYDEEACQSGCFGVLQGDEFMNTLMNIKD